MAGGYLHKFGGRKPDIPYQEGTCLTLSSHLAPEPQKADEQYINLLLSDEDDEEHRYQHPLEICHTRQPRPGPPNPNVYRIEVQIDHQIKVSDKRNAQVVMVKVLSISENTPSHILPGARYVVKFYDPLYNDHGDGADDHWKLADCQYTTEVAAYKKLADLQGDVVPTFLGSFSTEFSIKFESDMMGRLDEQTRTPPSTVKHMVRCILMGYVDGTTLHDIPTDIPDSMGQSIVKAILDAEAQLYLHDVVHRDLQPKNIILVISQEEYRAVLLDFADARLRRVADERNLGYFDHFDGQYISPLFRWDISNHGGEEYPGGEQLCPWVHFMWQDWLENTYCNDLLNLDPQKISAMRHTFVARCFEV